MSGALDIIKEVLPWIGTALGGPLAPIVGTLAAKALDVPADKVTETITTMMSSQEGVIKLKQLEADTQIHLTELGYTSIEQLNELIQKSASDVNATMRAETTAEHWPQYTWRPYNGFLLGTTIFANYFLLPLFHISASAIPPEVWIVWGGILGVASFFRGKMQADPEIPAATKIVKDK